MNRRTAPLLFAVLAWALAGCIAAPTPVPPTPTLGPTVTPDPSATATATPFLPADESATPVPPPTLTPSETPAPSPTPVPPTPTPAPPSPTIVLPPPAARTLYTINAALDFAGHSLGVGELIQYTNQSGIQLTSLVLAVEPNDWYGCFALYSLLVDDRAPAWYSLVGNRLEVPLAAPLDPGASVVLVLQYTLYLPPTSSSHVFGYNFLQANLVDWYPFIVPYDPAQGWLLHQQGPVGEHLVYEAADFDVSLQVPDPSVVVAASAASDLPGGYHYRLENARNFVFSASPYYLVSTTVAGPVTVASYSFASEATGAAAMLDVAARAVNTFSSRFGPYPHLSLSVVETIFPDGMEYDGLVFLNRDFYRQYDGTVLNNLVSIGVHEIAHQWWYGIVANDQALEPWLDEALSVYSECIFYEDNDPGYVNSWWAFRVDNFGPAGRVDVTIYTAGGFRSYTDAVYLRGARFVGSLRGRVGDEAFFAFLWDYAAQMSGRRATANDFFAVLRQHTTTDFSDVVGDYFQVQH